MRSNLLLRSVNRDLGAPVNRFIILARAAVKGVEISQSKSQLTKSQKLAVFQESLIFEFNLWWFSFSSWVKTRAFFLASFLGLVNSSVITNAALKMEM